MRHCSSAPIRRASIVCALSLALVGQAAQAAVTFPAGSLIIPNQSHFQDACGSVSSYGLIFKILQANDWLAAQGQPRITVYWTYSATKRSPNACVPTSLNTPPPYPGVTAPAWNDPNWNTGCDFKVVNTAGVPVKLVNNASPSPVNDTKVSTINTTTPVGQALAYPNYPSVLVDYNPATSASCNAPSVTANCNVSTVQYLGGAFVVGATDAANFLALLSNTDTRTGPGLPLPLPAKDSQNRVIDFTAFRTQGTCFVAPFTPTDGAGNPTSPPVAVFTDPTFSYFGAASEHYVAIHRAQIAFDAEANTKMSAKPPTIALLQTAGGVFGNGVRGDMLPQYLDSAGLLFVGAEGCPPGGYNLTFNTGVCARAQTGQVYDSIDVRDLESGLINTATDASGNKLYRILWTPHWEGSDFFDGYTGTVCDHSACIPNALKNVATFTEGPNGLMAECASLGVYEGAYQNPYSSPPGCDPTGADPTRPCSGTVSFWQYETIPAQSTQFLTCIRDPVTGRCSATQNNVHGVMIENPNAVDVTVGGYNEKFAPNPGIFKTLRNCTDPTMTSGRACNYVASPGNPFAQIGDFNWFTATGLVSNFFPEAPQNTQDPTGTSLNASIMYRPGSQPLAYTIDGVSLPLGTNPRVQAGADNFTFIQKGNNVNKAQIIYLGGHTYSSFVSGTRVVLNTLLNLGIVPQGLETGYVGATNFNHISYVPTYDTITAQGAPISWKVLDFTAPDQWIFPYRAGHFRAHPLPGSGQSTTLQVGDSVLRQATLWDAQTNVPAPGSRNVFTYLGGQITTNPRPGKAIPNSILQDGWQPVSIKYTSIPSSGTVGCVDKFSIGTVGPNAAGQTYSGMVSGADGVCDLQEALELTSPATPANFKLPTEIAHAQQLLQMVRGFCYAVDASGNWIPAPSSPTACVDTTLTHQSNVAILGGFVRSQAAIIGPSPSIPDAPAGKHRPTVAYVGGWDGQLHAFYVPTDGSDAGYTGPANPVGNFFSSPNDPLGSMFDSTFGGALGFAAPAGLTELWSFIPPGQLPYLKTNEARVDASPAVLDVLADFDGSGVRKWHTVLVASAGGTSREIFALDVTNPLRPVLLWDLNSSFDSTALAYAPTPLADTNAGPALAPQWQNRCRTGAPSCTTTNYAFPPSSSTVSGPYNYVRLGASLSVGAGVVRRNNLPSYAAFVATNEQGSPGFHIFALDIVTGQKLWEFDNPYDTGATARPGVGNNAPPGVSLFSKAGTSLLDTGYTGDEEGRLWEIDLGTGISLTSYSGALGCSSGSCNYALSDAYGDGTKGAQPISTQPTLFIVPPTINASSSLASFAGQPMLAYGTAGTDTVSSLSPTVTGTLHILPLAPNGRHSSSDVAGDLTVRNKVTAFGVSKESSLVTGYPKLLASGERIYGAPAAIGDHLFFDTSRGVASDLDHRRNLAGTTYSLDLNAAIGGTLTALTTTSGGAGGAAAVDVTSTGQVQVVTVTNGAINLSAPQTVNVSAPGINGRGQRPTGLLGWFFRSWGREY